MRVDEDGVIHGPFLRTRYNYDADYASRRTGLLCVEPTKAQQNFKEECDINTIVRNFGVTGLMPQNVRVPLVDEFIEQMDYQSSLNKLMEADAAFMQMPAEIRKQFGNDAGRFVDFVSDSKNAEQCVKWGLAEARPKPVVAVVPTVVGGAEGADPA